MLQFWEPHIEAYRLEYGMVHTRALESNTSSHLSDHGKVFKSLQLSLSVAKAANCLANSHCSSALPQQQNF